MKVVILAGGLGTRLAEETTVRAKPMVEVGGRPILWHILSIYRRHGFREFVIALGYKGEDIKNYFLNYGHLNSSLRVDLSTGDVDVLAPSQEDWVVTLVDTGLATNTGGRIQRVMPHLGEGPFMLTYGDGVADVDVSALVRFHEAQRKIVTLTAVRPPARFGGLSIEDGEVAGFVEKPQAGEGWINGGFMVCEPSVTRYLVDDATSFEAQSLERAAADGELAAYRHAGFWQCMDTVRDMEFLNRLCAQGVPPWLAE